MLDENSRSILKALAMRVGMDPASLMTVVDVESGGSVFARVEDRLEPLIRFEGHYFYRLLGGRYRNIAVVRGLADRRAGAVRNPRSQTGRWKLLRKAMAIDRIAALQSVSWGAGQVMGAHWQWLDYASVDALVDQARSGLEGQADLMIRFIRKSELVDAMNLQDWRAFARTYNGPGYVKHAYDRKLETAYDRYRVLLGERPVSVPVARHTSLVLRYGDQGEMVSAMQIRLRQNGYALAVDGDFGPVTEMAVKAFQEANGLQADGVAGPKTFIALERPANGRVAAA